MSPGISSIPILLLVTVSLSPVRSQQQHNVIQGGKKSLTFVYPFKNATKTRGEPFKLRCEVRGDPPATSVQWKVNEAPLPLHEDKGRIKVKESLDGETQWSRVRFRKVDTHDTGFYKCEATNGVDTIVAETILKVEMRKSWNDHDTHDDDDYDYDYDESSLVPESSPLDFDADLSHGVDGLPDHLKFHSSSSSQSSSSSFLDPPNARGRASKRPMKTSFGDLPSLKPDANAGECEFYKGSICSQYLAGEMVFVSDHLSQDYVESKLMASLSVIKDSPDLNRQCAEYAIPAICLTTLPICDRKTKKPRKICREECEVLEYSLCSKELQIVRDQPMIHHQMALPVCDELSPMGDSNSHNCVRLNIPGVTQLLKPTMCYKGEKGVDYRGMVSVTRSGATCKPWHLALKTSDDDEHGLDFDLSLVGGHNFCRNPKGPEMEEQPWCYTNDLR